MEAGTFCNNHGDPPKINVNLPEISEVTQNSKHWKDVQLPVDILLLTVKDCEFLSCYYYINDPFRSYFKGLGPVYFGSIGEDQDVKLTVALMKCSKGSKVPGGALTVVKNAVTQLRPKAVFSVGHCSGMNQESTKLGDVVVSEKLTTFSYQKVTKDGRKFCGFTTPVSRDITELIECASYGWNPPLENPKERKVEVLCGEVLSGTEVVQAEWRREELVKSFPEAIAIETEGEGIFSAAHDLKMEWVVVKGISRYTDGTESKKNWQTFASVTAASLVVNVLKKCSIFEDWPHYRGGSTEHLPRPKVKRHKEVSSPSDASTPKKRKTGFADPIPYYIKARGTIGLEAYRRALEAGETFDRRTKIALIGQDRVGKTSLRRYLRGEAFDEDEASTNGIEIISPIKNAGKGAWRNPAPLENTRALDHKCAEVAAKELLISSEERPHWVQLFAGEGKKTRGEPTSGKGATQERSNDDLASKEVIKKNVFQEVKSEKKPEDVPEKVLSLVERGLKGNDTSDNEGVWLFVWDFAGQALYHAIHPIFLLQEAIYVLVSDLTKELSSPAQCRVRPPNHDKIEVNSPYVEDTNLDHIMRWLDLVHSLGRPEFQRKSADTNEVLPPVVLVGTHADGVRDPGKEMESVKETICSMAHSATLGHISKESFFIDNTNPNRENDPQIVSLRAELLDLAKKMPHINKVIPMQWLRVEQKVEEMVKEKGMHYVGKKRFAEDISGGICQFNDTDDVEELLHFLQARGRIIYQDLPENPNGLVVLDPQWLMKILCEIITVRPVWKSDPVIQKDYQVLGNQGLLSQQLLNRAFEHLELSDIRNSLIHIMKSFDIICNSKNCKGEDYPYFVPCMLKSPKKNTRGTNMHSGPLPIFLSFNTNYVPSGLFCRLVVQFWEWASQLCGSCIAPTLFANAAKFNVSKVYQVTLECHKTVIEVIIRTPRDSDKMEEKRICEELLSHLERCRTRLSVTCSWLRSVTMQLFLKCQLCEPCPDKCRGGTNICILHKEEGCSHFDCGHYIPLRSFGLSCEHSVDAVPHYPAEKLDPWVQALESIERKKRTGCSTKHLRRPKVKRRDKESSRSDALTPKKRKHGLAGGSTEHLPRPKVKRLKEESSPSDASTPKKRKTGFAVKQGIPSDEDLGWLSEEVEKKWKAVGRRLGIQEARLTAFDNENREYFGKMYKMLLHWREKNGSAATYTVLHHALCHPLVNRTDLAEQLGANSNLAQLITDKCRGGTNICILFKEEGCSDFDNFPLRRFGLWKNSVGAVPYYPAKKLDPWVQALESKKQTGDSTKHLRRPKVNRRDEESSPCDALTAKKRKTGFAVKEGVPRDEELKWLSHQLENWEELGRRLKIGEATLTAFDDDYRKNRQKIYKMLRHWKQKDGSAATYMVLHDALCHQFVNRTDLAEQLCFQQHE